MLHELSLWNWINNLGYSIEFITEEYDKEFLFHNFFNSKPVSNTFNIKSFSIWYSILNFLVFTPAYLTEYLNQHIHELHKYWWQQLVIYIKHKLYLITSGFISMFTCLVLLLFCSELVKYYIEPLLLVTFYYFKVSFMSLS